jgi:hypothetical protein
MTRIGAPPGDTLRGVLQRSNDDRLHLGGRHARSGGVDHDLRALERGCTGGQCDGDASRRER